MRLAPVRLAPVRLWRDKSRLEALCLSFFIRLAPSLRHLFCFVFHCVFGVFVWLLVKLCVRFIHFCRVGNVCDQMLVPYDAFCALHSIFLCNSILLQIISCLLLTLIILNFTLQLFLVVDMCLISCFHHCCCSCMQAPWSLG